MFFICKYNDAYDIIIRNIDSEKTEDKRLIAYCGLDCEKCDTRKATLNNDNTLRESMVALWSESNGVDITPEMINCEGCRADGVKTPLCDFVL